MTATEEARALHGSQHEALYKLVDSSQGSHHKISGWISPGSVVLDVGCSTGYFAQLLQKKQCKVYGIESDKGAASLARRNCVEVLEGDAEQIEHLPWPFASFDFIVCADVLEHMRVPEMVLLKLRPYLKESGQLAVSIPNVAYWRVRIQLLTGSFDYDQVGILDRTHLRFYTLGTSRELLKSSGYEITATDYTGWAMNYYPLRLFPRLFAYQQLMLAIPRKEE